MTLQVPFDGFARAAHQIASEKMAFVTPHPMGSVVTCANPAKSVQIVAVAHLKPDEAIRCLQKEGIEVEEGIWTEDGQIHSEEDPLTTAYVAAVSYVSGEKIPGVWMDAYPDQPNHVQVLRAMYAEFRQTGELDDVTFEEFIRLANPNVVIVTANEIRGYLEGKRDAEVEV